MIKVYDGKSTNFTGQGLGHIFPIRAEVEEKSGGIYEIELEVPIDESRDDWLIDHQRIISAKAPTRTSPEINFGLSGEIKRQVFRTTLKFPIFSLANRAIKLGNIPKGMEMVRLAMDEGWYKVSLFNGGLTGWIPSDAVEYVREADDVASEEMPSQIIEEVLAREQLFRVYSIKRDTETMRMIVRAEHITYDLKGVICEGEYAPQNRPADEVVARLLELASEKDLPFNIFCQCTNLITADYTGRNIMDCLLNGDDGVVVQCNARIVRDNYSIYILDMIDRYTGADMRYGDNLIKAVQDTDSGDAVTRIRPVGKDKNGNRLYILENNGYVESPNAQLFSVQRTKEIEYTEARTGAEDLVTDNHTRQKLKELAEKEFENGADAIITKIDAEFVRRELTTEYVDLANEAALHMYDVAKIKADKAGVVARARMSGYKFDALLGRERYIDTTVSDVIDVEPMVYGINIGNNSVSGAKIKNNSIDGAAKIKDLSIGIAKIDTAAIGQLNAKSIAALIARINEIVAGSITSDELYASIAEIIGLKVESLTASDITTDRLAAALAAFTVITAGTAEFDRTTVQHLVAQALNLSFGAADEVFIENLRVAYGQMVQATIGNLCIRASDGRYYRIDVSSSGNVTATPVSVTEGEISAGQTDDGRVIVETNITADSLNTSNLLATYALINRIDAARIDVDELFAREAFITQLTTSVIYNDTSLQMVIGKYGDLSRWFNFDDEDGFTIRKPAWTDKEGVEHPESIWKFRATETGIQIIRTDMPGEPILSAERERVSTPSIQMGDLLCKRTATGGWVWTDA